MDLHRSYRMQQCAIDNIAGITVVTEQGVLKIFSKLQCTWVEKKLHGRELPHNDHFFWESADMNQTNIEKLCSD